MLTSLSFSAPHCLDMIFLEMLALIRLEGDIFLLTCPCYTTSCLGYSQLCFGVHHVIHTPQRGNKSRTVSYSFSSICYLDMFCKTK